jgi:hypothetical protein
MIFYDCPRMVANSRLIAKTKKLTAETAEISNQRFDAETTEFFLLCVLCVCTLSRAPLCALCGLYFFEFGITFNVHIRNAS